MSKKIALVLLIALATTAVLSFSTKEITYVKCRGWLMDNFVDSDKIPHDSIKADQQINKAEIDYIEFLLGLTDAQSEALREAAPIESKAALKKLEKESDEVGKKTYKKILCLGFFELE